MKQIGIKLADGSFYPILNDKEPGSKKLVLTTAQDNQTRVLVDIYRSETGSMEDAEYIDSLQIENLNEHPNGSPDLSLDISLDENNKLDAALVDPETGLKSKADVTLVSRTLEERLEPSNYEVKLDGTVVDEPELTEEEIIASDSTTVDSDATTISDFDLPEFGDSIPAEEPDMDFSVSDEISEDELNVPESLDETVAGDVFAEPEVTESVEETASDLEKDDGFSAGEVAAAAAGGAVIGAAGAGLLAKINAKKLEEEKAVAADETAPAETATDEPVFADFGTESLDLPDFTDTPAEETADTTLDAPAESFDASLDASTDAPAETTTDEPVFADFGTESLDLPDFTDTPAEETADTSLDAPAESFDASSDASTDAPAEDFALPEMDDISTDTVESTIDAPAESFDASLDASTDAPAETTTDEPVFADFGTESLDLPDFTDTPAEETAGTSLDAPAESFDASSDASTDAPAEDFALPEMDDISTDTVESTIDAPADDFELPDFSDTPKEEPEVTQSFDEPESSSNFEMDSLELPDFGEDIETSAADDIFADTNDEALNTDLDFNESESFVKDATPSSGIVFDGLYDKETVEGNSSSYDDVDSSENRTKVPVIICVICAIICIAATVFIFLMKSNILFGNKIEEPVKIEQVAPVEEPKAPEPVKEVIPEAKVEEVVVVTEPEKVEKVVPQPPKPQENLPKNIKYKIKWGDTLWDISAAYYKNPWNYKVIAKYNNIKDPDYIISGTTITIPNVKK